MDRNPSPPTAHSIDSETHEEATLRIVASKEPDESGDRIGDTVFSKLWVISLLEKILLAEAAESRETLPNDVSAEILSGEPPTVQDTSSDEITKSTPQGAQGDDAPDSMDTALEEELCLLWDASANSEVAKFLCELEAIKLLLEVADGARSNRFKEICMGIIGNLACVSEACKKDLCTLESLSLLMFLLASRDPGVLTQTVRGLLLCFGHEEAHVVEQEQHLVNLLLRGLVFILNFSTDDELLKYTSLLLHRLLSDSNLLLSAWAGEEDLVDAICEAVMQTCNTSREAAESLLMSLHLLTTRSEGVQSAVTCTDKVLQSCLSFLQSLDYLDSSHYTGIVAAASTYLCVHDHLLQDKGNCPSSATVIEGSARKKIKELISQADKVGDDSTETVTEVKRSLEEVLNRSSS